MKKHDKKECPESLHHKEVKSRDRDLSGNHGNKLKNAYQHFGAECY